ncbi:triose-phosphate isomerase [Candidatus Phytoplasma phoenicium]|uniref:Triosephosphate isomerase n=1 Tax=Candidatus Phytoplasma phoenicium TaxID=198422 RepID=A0A0L0MK15_9MOLU|nr:triose-phosphate isomerase [Candidatus Phytoplasma phoenicium]KND62630.1 Triosephosphate isomerase [Candidatus Phytoplasma phoenicium]
MRKIIIMGNWKMYKHKDESMDFIFQINDKIPNRKKIETVIFPPMIFLDALTKIEGENLRIGAQNIFYHTEGPYTGETSPKNIADLGIKYALIGHSERRILFGETDDIINLKILSALSHHIYPVLCFGETLEVKEQYQTKVFLDHQLEKMMKNIPLDNIEKIILAYEPIWAIGTGKNVEPEIANDIIRNIRKKIASLFSHTVAQNIRIVYGGSVNVNNVEAFLQKPEIDGILAGKSSLQINDFLFFTKIASNKKIQDKYLYPKN